MLPNNFQDVYSQFSLRWALLGPAPTVCLRVHGVQFIESQGNMTPIILTMIDLFMTCIKQTRKELSNLMSGFKQGVTHLVM